MQTARLDCDVNDQHKIDDACRRLRAYCNRLDQRLTTSEIIAALLQTSAAEIAGDIHRNKIDVASAAKDYGDLLRSCVTTMERDMRK